MRQGSKVTEMGLSFPYDWSNPDIGEEALIINVLNRGIYSDICRICANFGVRAVRQQAACLMTNDSSLNSLGRMLDNIEKGFCNAKA